MTNFTNYFPKFAAAVRTVNMHFSHDKHQYFFEKYLRHEMKGEELESFEKKLLENEKFKSDFDYYVGNRTEIVEDGLAEYDEPELLKQKPQKWGWVYTVISLLCLVLIIDYYFTSNYSGSLQSSTKRKPLIEKINIFKQNEPNREPIKETVNPTTEEKKPLKAQVDTTEKSDELDENLVQYMEGNRLAIQGDYYVSDSIFGVINADLVHEKTKQLRDQTDSLFEEDELNFAALKSIYKSLGQIEKQLLVEYWESPIHFRGYLFNGKKLLIYGLEANTPLFICLSEKSSTYHLFMQNKEFYLFPDNKFHQLADE